MAAATINEIFQVHDGNMKRVWGSCTSSGTAFHLSKDDTGLAYVDAGDIWQRDPTVAAAQSDFNVNIELNTAEGSEGDEHGSISVDGASGSQTQFYFDLRGK